jgi:hypothetical protein
MIAISTLPPCGGDVGTADRGGRRGVLVLSCGNERKMCGFRTDDVTSKWMGPPLSPSVTSPPQGGRGWLS